MCDAAKDYPPSSVYITPGEFAVIGQQVAVARLYARCSRGEHNYDPIAEDAMVLLVGRRERLVLYCHKCGDVIVHSLEEMNDAPE